MLPLRVRESVRVCERERDGERDDKSERVRETERVCANVCVWERERVCVSVCVSVCERESVCVCERESVCERERDHLLTARWRQFFPSSSFARSCAPQVINLETMGWLPTLHASRSVVMPFFKLFASMSTPSLISRSKAAKLELCMAK